MVKESTYKEPVGFVGWQERQERGKRVGYYSVGILPQHRRKSYARSAVSQLIQEKAASVDEVRAFIESHNAPSKALANALNVQVKEAGLGGHLAKGLYGLGVSSLIDLGVNKDKGFLGSLAEVEGSDPWTAADFTTNTIANAASMYYPNNPLIKLGVPALALGKSIAMPAVRQMGRSNDISDKANALAQAASDQADKALSQGEDRNKLIKGALVLGAGGVGIGSILALLKGNREKKLNDLVARPRGGTIKVTLPTKDPGDNETQIEIPMSHINMSESLKGRLSRDLRRRLLTETKRRTKSRKPRNSNALTPTEKMERDLDIERQQMKVAAAAPTVSSPPPVGVNPALRMTQEQQAAQQASAAQTAANPQIAEAGQAAEAVAQQAQADLAAAEQASQAALVEQEQNATAEMQRLENEKQVLRMQLETEKARADMEKQIRKQSEELNKAVNDGSDSAAGKMVDSRLKKIQQRMQKAAAVKAGPVVANDPEPFRLAKPGFARRMNSLEFAANNGMKTDNNYRASYGKIPDFLHDLLIRPTLTTPNITSVSPQMGDVSWADRMKIMAADRMLKPEL